MQPVLYKCRVGTIFFTCFQINLGHLALIFAGVRADFGYSRGISVPGSHSVSDVLQGKSITEMWYPPCHGSKLWQQNKVLGWDLFLFFFYSKSVGEELEGSEEEQFLSTWFGNVEWEQKGEAQMRFGAEDVLLLSHLLSEVLGDLHPKGSAVRCYLKAQEFPSLLL